MGDSQAIKFRELYNLTLQWVVVHQKNIKLSECLFKMGYKRIVIYGMSDIGNRLWFELSQDRKVQVLYTIDQGEPKQYYEFECFKLSEIENCEEPDVVIVTVPHLFETIKADLSSYFHCEIISMTELLYEVGG